MYYLKVECYLKGDTIYTCRQCRKNGPFVNRSPMLLLFYCLCWFIVFNATFNNSSVTSWRSVFLVEEIRVPGENHRPDTIHSQTLPHSVVSTHYIDIFELCHSHWALYKTLQPLTSLQRRKNISYLRNIIQIVHVIVVNIKEYYIWYGFRTISLAKSVT